MNKMSLTEQAYEVLKNRMISCELEPGAYYTEAGLAAQFELGQTPVREALARLAQLGWVRSVKGRGYEVLPLSLGGVRDLFGLRVIVEPAAIELASGRLEKNAATRLFDLCEFRFTLDDMQSYREYLRVNRDIHMTIISACGNSLLIDTALQLLERSERLMHLGMIVRNWNEEATEQHEQIVHAVVDGDGATARRLSEEHIRKGELAAIDAILATPDMQVVQVGIGRGSGTNNGFSQRPF